MTTFAVAAETVLDDTDDLEIVAPRSVANPRRTTWTGYAKNDVDRMPSS